MSTYPLRFEKKGDSAPTRNCGGCTLCCKALAIPELEKPQNQWCIHAKKGQGCAIHHVKPDPCTAFRCVWLNTHSPEEWRPDKIHGVLAPTNDGESMVLHEDPGWPGHASYVLRDFIDRFIADGKRYVAVVCAERRRLIARPDLLEKLASKAGLELPR